MRRGLGWVVRWIVGGAAWDTVRDWLALGLSLFISVAVGGALVLLTTPEPVLGILMVLGLFVVVLLGWKVALARGWTGYVLIPRWVPPTDAEIQVMQRAMEAVGEEWAADNPAAPILRWLDPFAELVDLSEHVNVWCENNGPIESVAVVLRRWAEMNRADESGLWESMEFEEFNVPSYIRSVLGADNRRFLVKMQRSRFAMVREVGPKVIRWSVIYKDAMLRHGYMTTCSMVVNFTGPGRAQIISLALDATSTLAERNRRYQDWIAQHGDPST